MLHQYGGKVTFWLTNALGKTIGGRGGLKMSDEQEMPFSEMVRLADLEVERRLKERERFYGLL